MKILYLALIDPDNQFITITGDWKVLTEAVQLKYAGNKIGIGLPYSIPCSLYRPFLDHTRAHGFIS